MEFEIEVKDNEHTRKYDPHDIEIAREFAKKAFKEFGSFIKAIVLFGSSAKRKTHKTHDIDILVIIDDLTLVLTPEAIQTYRIIMQKYISDTSKKIHLTTLKLTNFWDHSRNGDPIAINILRDGVALIDTGFFNPLQALLYQGRIRPTYESIWSYYSRAPITVINSKWHIMQATIDLYWACIDAAHAALMKLGEIPPSPEHVPDLMITAMVHKKLISPKYPAVMKDFYQLSKKIASRDIKEIKGREYDLYLKEAIDFIQVMERIIKSKSFSEYK